MHATLKAAIDAVEWTPAGYDYVTSWTDDTMPETRTVGFKSWMQSHHGDRVETLQLGRGDIDTPAGHPWTPGVRTLDARRRGNAAFFETGPNAGSWRYYAGVHVLVSDADMMIAADDFNVCMYRVVREA